MRIVRFVSLLLLAVLVAAMPLSAQSPKKPLTHDDYNSWKSISGSQISAEGNWILYVETPQDGDGRLIVLNSQSGKEYNYVIGYTGEGTDAERAARAKFSYNEKFVAFMISPLQEKIVEIKKDKKKKVSDLKKSFGIMNLATGEVTVVDSVKSFAMPTEKGGWIAYLKEKEESKKEKGKSKKEKTEEAEGEEKEVEKKEKTEKPEKSEEEKKKEEKRKKREDARKAGTELVLQSFDGSGKASLTDVTSYQFTEDGNHLFYITLTKDTLKSDGVFVITPGTETGTALLTGKGDYKRLTFNKDEDVVAFLTNKDDYCADEPTFNLYGMKVGAAKADLWVSHKSAKGFPEGLSVSDKSGLSFSEDGNVVMFSIKDIPEVEKDDDTADEKAKFELWHWDDPYPYPQQKVMANRVKDNGWEAVYHIKKKKFVQLGDNNLPDLSLNRTGKIAFANNNWPNSKKASYFGSFSDVYIVDTKTGSRKLIKKELFGRARLSPNGKYAAWFEGRDWFIYSLKTGVTVNLTKSLNVRFDVEDHDTPQPARAYGTAGWTDGEKTILLYDRYDIWEISPDGKKARMITEGYGRKNDLSFRYRNFDPDEITIKPTKKMLLQATNQNTMASGFYYDQISGIAEPVKALFEKKGFRILSKAKNGDKVIFTRQTVDEYPDLWLSGTDFADPQKISDLGAQTEPFIWGKGKLIDFKSSDGKPLKGIFIKPDNFDPNKKYPLMVYIYETLHNRYHSFRHPTPGSSVNTSYYVSNGYLIWMPDIEYDTGYPGKDALKCVLPGIQMLVNQGFVDEKAIGIQGHSWGGYQIAYMITQTNIFAAVEAGAVVSNMTSAYGGIRWDSGMVRQFQYEKTQSRLGASLWEVPMRYFENSPIFWADKVETPVMLMHNDKDGAVPWYQGIEFIMALRRLGKEAYMFNYNGEKHGLRKRVNQVDWTIRMAEFFDHHLKGAPMPDWMKHGIKAWDEK